MSIYAEKCSFRVRGTDGKVLETILSTASEERFSAESSGKGYERKEVKVTWQKRKSLPASTLAARK